MSRAGLSAHSTADIFWLVNLLRLVHAWIIVSKVIQTVLKRDYKSNSLIIALMLNFDFAVYFGAFLYVQYDIISFPLKEKDSKFVTEIKYYLVLEMITFYAQIVTMILFILYIQCRGLCGKKDYHANLNRYKHDLLDYYTMDIHYLSF